MLSQSSKLTNRFVSTTTNSMKCLVNWNPLRIRIRLKNTQPHLKRGPEARSYRAILKLIFQGQYALSKGHVLRLRCLFKVNL